MPKHVSKAIAATASANLAQALLQEVTKIGGDPAAVLARLRLPFSLKDLQSGGLKQISGLHFARLCRECMALLEDHACRLGVYPPMTQDEFDMLCYCVINCKNLAEVIERAAKFCAMLGGRAGSLSLDSGADSAHFFMQTFRGKPTASGLLVDITGLTAYHRLFSWLISETIEIAEIGVNYQPLLGQDLIFELFHYKVAFAQPLNGFQFPAHYLQRPVVRSHRELIELLKLFPFDLVATDLHSQTLSDALQVIIMGRLAKHEAIPTIAQLANLFNISSATFRRRLLEERTSIQLIKDKCRSELAHTLLSDPDLTLEEIAEDLGFSDANAFRRAFKSWTGAAPSDYRKRHAGAPLP